MFMSNIAQSICRYTKNVQKKYSQRLWKQLAKLIKALKIVFNAVIFIGNGFESVPEMAIRARLSICAKTLYPRILTAL